MTSVLCFGDSNTYGTPPMTGPDDSRRFDEATRWPSVMRGALGAGWHVIEEGLPARTTVHDDPIEGVHKNGRRYLLACLESHRPIDVVIVMLGTNDLKARFSLPPEDIASGVEQLAAIVASTPNIVATPPKLVIVAPPPILLAGFLAGMFAGGVEKSQRFATLYRAVAERVGAAFLDAGAVISSSPIDGIHFDEAEHRKLGNAVAEVVRSL